ncbi:hypothetical protein HYS48_00030 [Candidatus Woesearchaeota archaeon]|nr:hypothetical protein [Candidatus Woesearchaeota archaeon]
MKRVLTVSAICVFLLLATFAAAYHEQEDITRRISGGLYPESNILGYQRVLNDEYRNWFFANPRPQAQRILDVNNLEVNAGDLATPAVIGAQRILDPRYAWRYGYDLESGSPLLSPYGTPRVLKGEGFAGIATELGDTAMMRERSMGSFRSRRSTLMQMYYMRKGGRWAPRYNVRTSRFPIETVESMDYLDTRPIYLTEFERQTGLREMGSNAWIRRRYLLSQPGISFNELRGLMGEGALRSDEGARLQFLTRSGGYIQDELVTRRMPEGVVSADIWARDVWLQRGPGRGLVVYDRFPETRGETREDRTGLGRAALQERFLEDSQ